MCHFSLHLWESEKKTCFKYLATGESFASLGYSFRVGKNKIQGIVRETGEAIWKVLQPLYMAVPTPEEWLLIANEFNDICKMRNCIGSIDWKHGRIKFPPNAGSLYFNYESFHSMNLLGVADANLCFTLIDVGAYGREKDSSDFSNTSLGKAFSSGDLNVPPMKNIPGTSISTPLYLVGDETFTLKPNLMRPFPRRELDFAKTVFNDELSSTGRTIQCTFGLLTKKFGIFQKAFETNVEVTERTIKSAGAMWE